MSENPLGPPTPRCGGAHVGHVLEVDLDRRVRVRAGPLGADHVLGDAPAHDAHRHHPPPAARRPAERGRRGGRRRRRGGAARRCRSGPRPAPPARGRRGVEHVLAGDPAPVPVPVMGGVEAVLGHEPAYDRRGEPRVLGHRRRGRDGRSRLGCGFWPVRGFRGGLGFDGRLRPGSGSGCRGWRSGSGSRGLSRDGLGCGFRGGLGRRGRAARGRRRRSPRARRPPRRCHPRGPGSR